MVTGHAGDGGPLRAGETNDVLARAMHEEYVRAQLAKGQTAAHNPSLVAWDDLEESLRQSNRRFAAGIAAKLEAANCVLVPRSAAAPAAREFEFSDQEVEVLARMEHDRWASDLEGDGWRWGPEKDPIEKLHPLLVGWSDLSEEERDKDRAAVRGLPGMVSQAGFEIRRA